jgi:uncharacterized membrane protein
MYGHALCYTLIHASRTVSNLIVAGFNDAHTAFLARAALARLQKDLSLPGRNLAVMTREEGGEIVLQEAISLGGERAGRPTYWETLVRLLFASGPLTGESSDAASAKLAAMGIDAAFRSHFGKQIRDDTSILLALSTGPVTRDKVLGVLHGFQGKVVLTELTGDDREVWRRARLGGDQMEEMK